MLSERTLTIWRYERQAVASAAARSRDRGSQYLETQMECPALFYFGAVRDLAELKARLEEIDAAHNRAL